MTRHHSFFSGHTDFTHIQIAGARLSEWSLLPTQTHNCHRVPLLHCAPFLSCFLTHLMIGSDAPGPCLWFIWKAINQTHKSRAPLQPRNPHENLHLFFLLLLFFLPAWLWVWYVWSWDKSVFHSHSLQKLVDRLKTQSHMQFNFWWLNS